MELKNLTMSYGVETLFQNVNLIIPDNEKVGIVGVNGAGKTTLFKLIMGMIEADTGKIIKGEKRVGWLPQVISEEEKDMNTLVFDYLIKARPIDKLNKELNKLYSELASEPDSKSIYKKIEKIENKLNYYDAYNAENTLLRLIDGINLGEEILYKKLKEISGGQKSKVAFIKLLYSMPEIILLDEPTNHLDEKSRDYVISYLKSYKGSVLVISHDTDFLDKVTNKTLFIDKRVKSIELYDGAYSKFIKVKNIKEEMLIREASIQEREEIKLRNIINKYSNSSGKRKKMAQDREKKLEKLLKNKIQIIKEDKKVNINMDIDKKSSSVPLKISNLCFKYKEGEEIIDNLNFEVRLGEKFLVVGNNGVGKSTLLKLIAGILKPDKGEIKLGNNTKVGYYAQELELLDNSKTILENMKNDNYSQRELRSILSKFLFFNEDVNKKVSVLSPGEKARLSLAKLSISKSNLLLLDEPTNHLDPLTRKIISEVFKSFKGTLIVVSHNVEFVEDLGIERTLLLPDGILAYYNNDIVNFFREANTSN